jgi:hypothetical protein
MKSGAWKHFAIAGVFAIVLYAASYSFIEHMRQRKGGWHVTFASDLAGQPEVWVAQPVLGITNVQFRFPGEKISAMKLRKTVVFTSPITNVPFGQIIFIDTTFLPGTITFDLFGHEVQLLPRILIVNKREVPWQSNQAIELTPVEKLPSEVRKRLRKLD